MERGNGGALPRRPSCPQLPSQSGGSPGEAAKQVVLSRSTSLAGLSCPATPVLRSPGAAAPQTSSSLASADSGCQQPAGGAMPAAVGDCSDATSGMPRLAAEPAVPARTVDAPPRPAGPAAPLACMQLGAPGEALPAAVVHWPMLPAGTTWGTPVGCGVPPPPLPGAAGGSGAAPARAPAQPAFPRPSIKWCPPGSLPVPATTYDLLLPEDFSLARAAAEACDNAAPGGCPRWGAMWCACSQLADLLLLSRHTSRWTWWYAGAPRLGSGPGLVTAGSRPPPCCPGRRCSRAPGPPPDHHPRPPG